MKLINFLFNWNGTCSRKAFFFFVLATSCIWLGRMLFSYSSNLIESLFDALLILPYLVIATKRARDCNLNIYLIIILSFIPFLDFIIFCILHIKKSKNQIQSNNNDKKVFTFKYITLLILSFLLLSIFIFGQYLLLDKVINSMNNFLVSTQEETEKESFNRVLTTQERYYISSFISCKQLEELNKDPLNNIGTDIKQFIISITSKKEIEERLKKSSVVKLPDNYNFSDAYNLLFEPYQQAVFLPDLKERDIKLKDYCKNFDPSTIKSLPL